MKRKDAQMVINKVGAMTCRIEGTMHLLNKEDGTGIEVDCPRCCQSFAAFSHGAMTFWTMTPRTILPPRNSSESF